MGKSLKKAKDVFSQARVKLLFALLVIFFVLDVTTFWVLLKNASSFLEPLTLGVGLLIYLTLLINIYYGISIGRPITVFLFFQVIRNNIFGFLHTQNDGFDGITVAFQLMGLTMCLMLAKGKLRPYLIGLACLPFIHGIFAINGLNPFPDLVAEPRTLPTLLFLVPVVLISLMLFIFSKSENQAVASIFQQKSQIEDQHRLLGIQHIALSEEKAKTQKMLERIEVLFGQQVSKEVVNTLVASSEEKLGQQFNVTVMFLDIRDFTKFADTKEPQEVATFQNIVFGELIPLVNAHNGVLNQILGDGMMAYFGAPVANNTHPTDAVTCAFKILESIERLIEKSAIPPIRLGIGLNSGMLVAGNIGNQMRKQYSLTGTTVIIAARIESLNKMFNSQFLISENTYQLANLDGKPAKFLGLQPLKGIKREVGIYQLL